MKQETTITLLLFEKGKKERKLHKQMLELRGDGIHTTTTNTG